MIMLNDIIVYVNNVDGYCVEL